MPAASGAEVSEELLGVLLEAIFPEGGETISGIIDFIFNIDSGTDQLSQISAQLGSIQTYITGLPLQTTNMVNYVQAIGLANLQVSNRFGILESNVSGSALVVALQLMSDNGYASLNNFISRGAFAGTDYYSVLNQLVYYAYNSYIDNFTGQPINLGSGNCYANDLFNNTNLKYNTSPYIAANIFDLVTPHILLATTVSAVAATVINYASQVFMALQLANEQNLYGPDVESSTKMSIASNISNAQLISDLTPVTNTNNNGYSVPFYTFLSGYISCGTAPQGICGNAATVFNYICNTGYVNLLNGRSAGGNNYYLSSNGASQQVLYSGSPAKWWASFYGMGTDTFASQSLVNLANADGYVTPYLDNEIIYSTWELYAEPESSNLQGEQSFTVLALTSVPSGGFYTNCQFLLQWGQMAVVNNIGITGEFSPGLWDIDVTDADQWWSIIPDA